MSSIDSGGRLKAAYGAQPLLHSAYPGQINEVLPLHSIWLCACAIQHRPGRLPAHS